VALCLCGSSAAQNAPTVAGEDSSEIAKLDALASKPYRPSWAPLPVFRDSVALVPYLQEQLSSSDRETREKCAFLLGQIGYRQSAKYLSPLLNDGDRAVRVQAGIALACLGDPKGVPVCASALASDPPWIRYYAVCGLWRVGSPRAKRALRENPGGQSKLVSDAIKGALTTRHAVAPEVLLPKSAPGITADDVLQAVSDRYILESDWWWHDGNYEQGIRCMEALVFLDPSDVQSFGLIAWLQWNLGREAESVATLKKCIEANPSNPDAHFELGRHYMTEKQYALAEEPLRKSLELGGDHLAHRQYAHCLEKLGRLNESLAEWAKILETLPNDAAARYNHDRIKGLLDAQNAPQETSV
jgi:hypothetical protein